MELVKGVSITDYCDANSLSTKERLELFIQVCNAVQHAHQKGIIHRDIKPTNVMVTLHDGKPVPKVIDFGIAKAINQKLTEKTLFTRYAHIIGTPAYMSPEQAELSDLDIDTRTDIYSLGVLLYELLTGTTPFGEEELRKAGYIEMQRVIREQEPTKPSTKLSTLGKTLTDVAKHHNSTPDLLRKAIRGDLDWIVMKSLEKDRSRRYETANGLALDIQRHIEHEPVLARGPAATYRLQKFLHRHRSQTVAALAMAVVVASVVVILSMWNQDRLQLTEAEGFKHRGILSQAREQYAKADREAALDTIKPVLDSRHIGPEAQLLYAGILVDNRRSGEAVTVLGSLLDERAVIAGAAHSLLARILWESESPNAETIKEIDDHRKKAEALLPQTAEAYFLRAMAAMTVKEQLASLDKALQLDPAHYESRRLRAFTYYASRKYDRMKEDALVMEVLRPRDPLAYSLRAIALHELSKYAEAIKEYDNAIGLLTKADPQYADLSAQRCETLLRMGDYERLIADAQERLNRWPDRPVFQYYTFSALTALGDYEKADAVFREIVTRTPTARNEFRDWCAKYVFDTLEAGRFWHLPGPAPTGAAFLPLVEPEETYRGLSAKGHRVITNGFSAQWSPDGKKLVFSLGVQGYSGIALYDPATQETELLIVPGKDPRWSPDGRHIAFVRDCRSLRVPELVATDRRNQLRVLADEEVWLMKADGTEPRRLALGGWPSWGRDSTCLYYKSRVDNALYSISTMGTEAEAKRIVASLDRFPSPSPDGRYLAYVDGASLKVEDLASRTLVAAWPTHCGAWCEGPAWSPRGDELCMGGGGVLENGAGLWVYRLDRSEPVKTLDGWIAAGSWSPDGAKLVFELDLPPDEIWAADLGPEVSVLESLGPGQTPNGHYRERVALWTRRIEADPQDAYAYSNRAECYDRLHERTKAAADMSRWSTLVGGFPPDSDVPGAQVDFLFGEVTNLGPPINTPWDEFGPCLSADGREFYSTSFEEGWDIGTFRRCWRETVDGPWGEPVRLPPSLLRVATSCLSADGLSLYVNSDQHPGDISISRRASLSDPWGPPESLGPNVNSPANEIGPSISADGIELYFTSNRPGGFGGYDVWVSTRTTAADPWGKAVNAGPRINSPPFDGHTCITSDGLMLFVSSRRCGGYGDFDLWISRRATNKSDWGPLMNLGPGVNTTAGECDPCISYDGRVIYFSDLDVPRPGGYGGGDLWVVSVNPPLSAAPTRP
jgi:Tol biopolymer transport system component